MAMPAPLGARYLDPDNDLTIYARVKDWEIFAPDWEYFREYPALELGSLCPLSVGLHPYWASPSWVFLVALPHFDGSRRDELADPAEPDEEVENGIRAAVPREFMKRVHIAPANLAPPGALRIATGEANAERTLVHVADFAAWAKGRGWTLPPEFSTEAPPQIPDEVSEQSAHSGAPEEGPEDGDMETGEIIDESATAAGDGQAEAATLEQEQAIDRDDVLASLFNPVKAAQLEAMFPDDGKWKVYAERAKRNGLAPAKVARSAFNPYLAALWWIGQGQPGWRWGRCLRVLSNNLPARSSDSKHLLTGEID